MNILRVCNPDTKEELTGNPVYEKERVNDESNGKGAAAGSVERTAGEHMERTAEEGSDGVTAGNIKEGETAAGESINGRNVVNRKRHKSISDPMTQETTTITAKQNEKG